MGMTAFRREPLLIGALLSTAVLTGMVPVAILPGLPKMSAFFASTGGGGTMAAQLAMTIAAPGIIVGAPVAGWLADRLGKRSMFLCLAILYAVLGVAGGLTSTLPLLFASRFLLGAASGGLTAVATSLIAEFQPIERRDRLLGWSSMTASVGAFAVLLVAGPLAEVSWRLPFGLYLSGLVTCVIAAFSIQKPIAAPVPVTVAGGAIRPALRLFLLMAVMSTVVFMPAVQGPFLLVHWGIVSPTLQALFHDSVTAGSIFGA